MLCTLHVKLDKTLQMKEVMGILRYVCDNVETTQYV